MNQKICASYIKDQWELRNTFCSQNYKPSNQDSSFRKPIHSLFKGLVGML